MDVFVKELATRRLSLRFFDLDVDIWSDRYDYLDHFARMYHRFRITQPPAFFKPTVEFQIITRPEQAGCQPIVIFDERSWALPPPEYLYDIILKACLASVQSHFLFHAGVVAKGNQGVIITADSFHGKTTLVLELVRRGLKFLSDETAALGRTDQLVHPFPRSLLVRPGTLEFTGLAPLKGGIPIRPDRWLLDIEQIRPDSLGQAVAINHIIILQDSTGKLSQDSHQQELAILVDHLDEAFLAAIRRLKNVTEVRVIRGSPYPWLKLRSARRTHLFFQIEALCRAHNILVLNVKTEPVVHPDFTGPARLEAIPTSEAVLGLLERFQGGYHSAILQEFGGSTTRLFMELAAIVGQADCYRLQVGPLHKMADLVCGLVGMGQNENR